MRYEYGSMESLNYKPVHIIVIGSPAIPETAKRSCDWIVLDDITALLKTKDEIDYGTSCVGCTFTDRKVYKP